MDNHRRVVLVNIKALMEKKGLSTAEFASQAGISYNTALSLQRSSGTRFDLDVLTKTCRVLDVHPSQLFDLVEQ